MGTKRHPGEFDCYANAEPDEPMFVLLGRDPLAPALVYKWAADREESRGYDAKVAEAIACAEAMERWHDESADEPEMVFYAVRCLPGESPYRSGVPMTTAHRFAYRDKAVEHAAFLDTTTTSHTHDVIEVAE